MQGPWVGVCGIEGTMFTVWYRDTIAHMLIEGVVERFLGSCV